MNTLASTFEVSGVPRATEPLPEVRHHQAVDHLLKTFKGAGQGIESVLFIDVYERETGPSCRARFSILTPSLQAMSPAG
jgi:hypothetical protein